MRQVLIGVFLVVLCSFKNDSGKLITAMDCHSLSGKELSFPSCLKGKYSILGFAMTTQAGQSMQTWFKPVFYNFIYKPEKDVLFRTEYDVNLYFVAMFSESNNSGYLKAKTKLNEGLDTKLKPYVLMYKGDVKTAQKTLGIKSSSVPYIYVLNSEGRVVYKTQGAFTESKMMAIENVLDDF